MDILSRFHPLIARWFLEQIGEPTDIQTQSWLKISDGSHVLISAPTGSGKTLAAFLWAINQLVTGLFDTGYTSILYVSPLRALNNDIQRNLLKPLEELQERFNTSGVILPDIRVETRSGDTPQSARVQMLRHPPEILITTPESLNILLSSASGRAVMKNLSTVILDEIHAVLGTKRGTYLMTAVERLVQLSGEFQRITLSATINPMEPAARFVGGFMIKGDSKDPTYIPRTVSIVTSQTMRHYDLQVRFTEPGIYQDRKSVWTPIVFELKEIIKQNRSTLLFANSRRLCEKLALDINQDEELPIVYVHHGSLSREIRTEVERKLRDGELKAVIATNSLELGIDIGVLDEVVLIQSPPTISSAIQRVGRSKHQVGQICKGTIFPTHPHDLLEAAVLTKAITSQDMEVIKTINCPLDVLAQVIVSMVGSEKWDIDVLYAQVKASYSYHSLSRQQFNLVLNMLAGQYADSQIRELKPQVSVDRLDNTVVARKGALLAVYTSGGVIPDRGYFRLRHQETNALIGELDEEFVWESSVGKTFSLGAQNWRIERITHNDVFVHAGNPNVMAAPFWRGEENYRDFHFSEHIGEFLELANTELGDPDFAGILQRENHMDYEAAAELIDFLKRQKEVTGNDLPHRHHILLEFVSSGPGGVPGNQLVIHTLWGNRVNRPLAMALDAAWEARFGQRLEIYTSNDCIIIQLPSEMNGYDVLSLVSSATIEPLLRKRLESSGFFGARFRECAGRALLLPRSRVGQRMPLWMNRLRSQKLLNAVIKYEDFPLLLETWRTCLIDEFDMDSLKLVLAELESGVICWSEVHTSYLSPMAQHIIWRQTNEYMYMGDEPQAGKESRLREDLLRHVVFTPDLRPSIGPNLVTQFEQKRQRLAPGYSPEDARELVDWVKERLLIPATEWEELQQSIYRDHGISPDILLESVADKLIMIVPPTASEPLIVALESFSRITFGLFGTNNVPFRPLKPLANHFYFDPTIVEVLDGNRDEILTTLLSEWLQFYGPTDLAFISTTLGVDRSNLTLTLEDLIDSQKVIAGQLVTGASEEQICDSENFEVLVRMARRASVPSFEVKEVRWLPLFLAHYQGVGSLDGDVDTLFRCLDQLRCFPTAAELWESEIFPSRLQAYSTSWLDSIMQEGNLRWVGGEKHTATFCFESDLVLMHEDQEDVVTNSESKSSLSIQDGTPEKSIFPDALGRYDFLTLLTITGYHPNELTERLWEGVWQGRITNDSFAALRKGIMTRFTPPKTVPSRKYGNRTGRISFSRWKASLPFAGNWFQLPPVKPVEDILEGEERIKERVRTLLDRYGILFRELLERESPLFRWRNIFKALRLMELSGEVLAGYFFKGVSGPQFMTSQTLQILQSKLKETVYWINATDPTSLCGVQIEDIRKDLPKRIASNHLVYHGTKLVVTSQRNGRTLTFHVPPDDPHLFEYFGFLKHLLNRQFQPMRRIVINTINGETAIESPYTDVLKFSFDTMTEGENVILYRKRNFKV